MGVETTVMQCVFFKRKDLTINQTKERKSCSDVNCKNHKKNLDSKFCPRCGSPVVAIITKEVEEVSNIYSLIANSPIENLVWEPAYPPKNTFLLNFFIEGLEDFEIDLVDDDDFKAISFNSIPANIMDIINADKKVKQVLNHFNSLYGDDFVTVHFGVYAYAN